MSHTDQEILEMISNPSTRETGYRVLIHSYQRRIYGIIRKMVIIHEDADDVTQNTFIKAFRYIHKFEHNSSLFTWLYKIATNESLNFLKKKKTRLFLPIEDHQELMENYLSTSPLINGEFIERKLQMALLKLPDKQRLVFNLRYFEDLPYEEISRITGTSVGALKASYHHAVKKVEIDVQAE